MKRPRLVIFARAPMLGRVKKRLARDIGAGPALQFYRRALAGVGRQLARDRRWTTCLAVTPDGSAARPRLWPLRSGRQPQGSGDLGRRMARVLGRFTHGPVAIVGSDIPDLRPCHVWRAFRALAGAHAVLGPATDGGFWLIGWRRGPLPYGAFNHVRWSTEHALDDTVKGLRGCRVACVDRLADVDSVAAWEIWRAQTRR